MKSLSPAILLAGASLAMGQASTTTSSATSTSAASSTATVNCDLPHLIVARGSDEAPGQGRMGVIAGNVTEKIKGATVEALDYPATFSGYINSEEEGVSDLKATVKNYLGECPNGKIVLMGYSQGAQVTADFVCGASEAGFNTTADLGSSYQDKIVAVVLFGDPSHVANASFNAGNSTHDGLFSRVDVAACQPFIPKMRSWCNAGDIYCDSGNNTSVHGSYFALYTDAATNFVVQMWEQFQSGNSSATGTTGGSGTAGATGTGSATGSVSPTVTTSGVSSVGPAVWLALMAGLVAATW